MRKKMKIIKLPRMDIKEIREALTNEKLCRIAFIEDNFPYISPFQYVNIENTLYFHFTNYGKKKKILEKNRNVCVYIEHFEKDLSQYFFISIQGELILLDDSKEKTLVIQKILEEARKQFSINFLTAHGFDKDKGWDTFKKENLLIYKLKEVGEPIGLKSL
ncbi:MAG: pyridoxamine 5'-phosphate oxidase family protein [Candidatus Lokiarchaeota archaeon]|nr:pyridoxamine 5'-phosphate oxidase family protein [Candidatus Lokiarchaeota archaeon]